MTRKMEDSVKDYTRPRDAGLSQLMKVKMEGPAMNKPKATAYTMPTKMNTPSSRRQNSSSGSGGRLRLMGRQISWAQF